MSEGISESKLMGVASYSLGCEPLKRNLVAAGTYQLSVVIGLGPWNGLCVSSYAAAHIICIPHPIANLAMWVGDYIQKLTQPLRAARYSYLCIAYLYN